MPTGGFVEGLVERAFEQDCTSSFVPSNLSGSTIDSLKKRIIQTSSAKESTAAELEVLLRLTAAEAIAGKSTLGSEPISVWEDQTTAHWENTKEASKQSTYWVDSSEPRQDDKGEMLRVEEREEMMSSVSNAGTARFPQEDAYADHLVASLKTMSCGEAVVAKFINTMRIHKNDVNIHTKGCKVFANYAAHGSTMARKIVEFGAARSIHSSLLLCEKNPVENRKLFAAALEAISGLSYKDARNAETLRRQGVARPIIKMLPPLEHYSKVQIRAFEVLYLLGYGNTLCLDSYIACGLVQAILNAIVGYADDVNKAPELLRQAIGLLTEMSRNAPERKAKIASTYLEHDGVKLYTAEIFEDLLCVFDKNEEIRNFLVFAMASIVRAKAGAEKVADSDFHLKVLLLMNDVVTKPGVERQSEFVRASVSLLDDLADKKTVAADLKKNRGKEIVKTVASMCDSGGHFEKALAQHLKSLCKSLLKRIKRHSKKRTNVKSW